MQWCEPFAGGVSWTPHPKFLRFESGMPNRMLLVRAYWSQLRTVSEASVVLHAAIILLSDNCGFTTLPNLCEHEWQRAAKHCEVVLSQIR